MSKLNPSLSLNPHKNLESIIATSIITLTCFILSFVFGSLSFIPRDIHAEVAQVSTNIAPVISLVLDETDLVIAPVDVTSGAVATNTLTATVSTNNVTGYSLSMSTTGEDIDLTHTNGVSKITSTASASPATLSSNTWGYNLADSLTDFRKIPALSVVSTINSSSSPIANDKTKITLGVKANISIPAGTYSNELVFTAVANYVPVPTITSVSPTSAKTGDTITITGTNFTGATSVTIGGTDCTSFTIVSDTSIACVLPDKTGVQAVVVNNSYGESNKDITVTYLPVIAALQDFSSTQCSAMTSFPNGGTQALATTRLTSSSDTTGLSGNNTAYLEDNRNHQTYRIRKLADNKCWMIDNLKIYNTTLTYADTDITVSGNTFTLPATLNTAGSTVNDAARIDDPSSPQASDGGTYCNTTVFTAFPNTTTGCGYLYNWYTAILGEDGSGNLNTGATNANLASVTLTNSICPKNWHLPVNGDYGDLETAIGGNGLQGQNQLNSGFEAPYSGLYSSGFYSQGYISYFWSSSAHSIASYSYTLTFFDTTNSPAGDSIKSDGVGVRCSL